MGRKVFEDLVRLMRTLRGKKGCPWDREQTLKTLKPYLVEECYEVWEAIDENDSEKLREELGDLLFQVIFCSQIAREKLDFDIYDVVRTVRDKMIRRHPHVFGNKKVRDSGEVLKNWEEIKKEEKGERNSVLEGVPKKLPALLRAHRIQSKASRVGFDWDKAERVMDKMEEEYWELKEACKSGKTEAIEEEMGDLLFTLVNASRFLKINPEDALHKTIAKFTKRFRYIEKKISEEGENLKTASLEKMDRLWNKAKKVLK